MTFEEAIVRFDELLVSPVIKKRLEIFKEVIVHSRGIFPKKFVQSIRPHRDKKELDYIESLYQPMTQAGMNRGIDSLNLIFTEKGIKAENISDVMADAMSVQRFDSKGENLSFKEFYQSYILRLDIEDPNGGVLWLPKGSSDLIPDFRFEIPKFNPSERITGYPVYVNSGDVIVNEPELLIVRGGLWTYRKDDKTGMELDAYGKPKKVTNKEPYYWFISKDEIHIYIPVGDDNGKVDYKLEPYYAFKNKGIPFDILRGDFMADADGNCIFNSYFSGYLAPANDAIRMYILFQLNSSKHGFIIRSIAYVDCEHCQGKGKINQYSDDDEKRFIGELDCTVCKGMKRRIDFTPLGDIVQPRRRNADPDQATNQPPVEFHEPPKTIMEFDFDKAFDLLDKADASVNIREQNMTNQSGESKKYDNQYFEAFLKKFGDNFYRLVSRGFEHWANYLDTDIPQVIPPREYKLESPETQAKKIKSFLDSGVPQFVINDKIGEINEALNEDPISKKIFEVIKDYDALFGVNPDAYAQLKLAGYTNADIQRSRTLAQRLRRIANETDSFLLLSNEELFNRAEAKFIAPVESVF